MTETQTTVRKSSAFYDLMSEFAFYLYLKMEEFCQSALVLERMARDSGMLA